MLQPFTTLKGSYFLLFYDSFIGYYPAYIMKSIKYSLKSNGLCDAERSQFWDNSSCC